MKRPEYKVDGQKVPSLTSIIDNCKIGGIGNLLYRANQDGLAGRSNADRSIDALNPALCLKMAIEADLLNEEFDTDDFSNSSFERSNNAFDDYLEFKFKKSEGIRLHKKNISLVSENNLFGATFDIFTAKLGQELALIHIAMAGQVYPEYLVKLAAHASLIEENALGEGLPISCYVLRISTPKTIEEKVEFNWDKWSFDDLHPAYETFEKMREIYDLQDTLKTIC